LQPDGHDLFCAMCPIQSPMVDSPGAANAAAIRAQISIKAQQQLHNQSARGDAFMGTPFGPTCA